MKSKSLLALGVILVCIVARAPLAAAQKPASPPPTAQDKLKERVDALDSRINAAEQKSDRAAMEKDYLEKTQKHYEDYYEKTRTAQNWTLGLVGLILTVVFGLTARFGLSIVDNTVKHALAAARDELRTELRTEFTTKLAEELQKLQKSNADQINQLDEDLKARSDYQFNFAQGLTLGGHDRYADAKTLYRTALGHYNSGKARQVIPKKGSAVTVLTNIFGLIKREHGGNFAESATEELARKIYDDLPEELALAALDVDGLGPLLKERKDAPTTDVSSR